MAESSAPDGFPVTLTVAAGAAVDNQIAVMMKDMLAQIDIDVAIELTDPTAQFDRFVGDYEMTLLNQTSDNLDPDTNLLYCCVSDGGANSYYTGWKDPEVDALPPVAGRIRFRQAQSDSGRVPEVRDGATPFIEVVNPPNPYASRTTTHNFFMDPTAHWHLAYVWKRMRSPQQE